MLVDARKWKGIITFPKAYKMTSKCKIIKYFEYVRGEACN